MCMGVRNHVAAAVTCPQRVAGMRDRQLPCVLLLGRSARALLPVGGSPEAVTNAAYAADLRITPSNSEKAFYETTFFGHGRPLLAFMYIMLLLLQNS